jgi:hypothetical protein
LSIAATGEKPVVVPLQVKVADWTLPDPQDRRTLVEILQSPDTLAAEYNVPLWSDRHWELIAESLRHLSDSGSRTVFIPLIAETNFGHEQTMVRWIRKGDSQYEYDFSIMEKYLGAVEKNLGKPTIVVFYVWDTYMPLAGRWQAKGEAQGPVVTAWDPAAGKAQRLVLPQYTEAGSEALWSPLVEQLRQRLARRGLEKAMMLGMMTDVYPTKEQVAFWAKIAPGAPWVIHSHSQGGMGVYQIAKVGYEIRVWSIRNAADTSLMGWKRPQMLNCYFRQADFNAYPSATWRQACEFAITGDQRGVGRLGGEFWPVIRDKSGLRKDRIYARYPQSGWQNLNIYTSLLAPGPNGPIATHHYAHLLEGIQECEARIAIERALSDEASKSRLGEDLIARCQAVLEERLRAMQRSFCPLNNRLDGPPFRVSVVGIPGIAAHFWYCASDWEARAESLFNLAGQVSARLAPK